MNIMVDRIAASDKKKDVIVTLWHDLGGSDGEVKVFGIIIPRLRQSFYQSPSSRMLAKYFKSSWPAIRDQLVRAKFDEKKIAKIRREVVWDMTPGAHALPNWLRSLAMDLRFHTIR